MRTFLVLALLTGAFLYGGLRTPRTELYQRVLRVALFSLAGLFGALLASAMLQALFLAE